MVVGPSLGMGMIGGGIISALLGGGGYLIGNMIEGSRSQPAEPAPPLMLRPNAPQHSPWGEIVPPTLPFDGRNNGPQR
jgi:hypothetical protein